MSGVFIPFHQQGAVEGLVYPHNRVLARGSGCKSELTGGSYQGNDALTDGRLRQEVGSGPVSQRNASILISSLS